ncbi:MAG: hypothetical protein ACI9UD_002077 [Glaciecola sp.]|jgi:hypothetical protein
MVLILLELGANGKHTNHNEHTPLMSAAAAEPTVSDTSSAITMHKHRKPI